jgi:sulfur-carrier protein
MGRTCGVDKPASSGGSAPPVVVTVRYWAAARAAAGLAEEKVQAATLADAVAQLRAAHGDSGRFQQVLDVCSFLVGDQPVGKRDPASVILSSGDVVEVLPPFAGG